MMAKDKSAPEPQDPAEQAARYPVSDADKAKARKWFKRAEELASTKSWEFAIKCYVDGLNHWPDAVEEALQPLRTAACTHSLTGGKKPGFTDSMKYSMSGKDAKKALSNSLWLLSHDPFNVSYMEGVLKNANRLQCEDMIMWVGPIFSNGLESEKKLSAKRFGLLVEVYEEAGDRAAVRGEQTLAVECYDCGVRALRLQGAADPKDHTLEDDLRDLTTKLTILKGKYDTGGTFQDSMRDAEGQKDAQQLERRVQSEESLVRLIAKAEQDLATAPENSSKIHTLVELLCRREDKADERKAIDLLVEKFKTYGEFRFRMQAEDIRMRQMRRKVRKARDDGDAEQARKLRSELLKFEIRAFGERVKQYPTDNRLRYDLAVRLFQTRKFDEAIPEFQAARADPKVRLQADLYVGRCFFEKKFFAQTIGTLTTAISNHEIGDDTTAKELRYWLSRGLEADGRSAEASETYGQILQLDYNFRDVRDRLERLQSGGSDGQ